MKKILALLLLLNVCVYTNAQEEAAIWYFGNKAGLDFNSGVPVALTDGELNTIEGCATIADSNGDLLFYTDGITVWAKNHQPMPSGSVLGGHPSSTQSGTIVPWPGNPDLYYILTTDQSGDANGLQYSIVDMTLNAGFGDVISKNNVLQLNMTEKITAVAHANGSDIWVISHRLNSDQFISYQITPAGLNTIPVITPIGLTYSGVNAIGYMKASPNGAYVSIVASGTAKAEILEFNANTGVLSSPINLSSFYNQFSQFNLINLYGVEFSPNSQVLYISNANNGIHQFNLANYNAVDILTSGIQVAPTGAALEIGGMQLAIDSKIYVTQAPTNYLGAINSPNIIGLGCNYVENVVSLGSGISNIGLPTFIQSYFIVGVLVDNFCLGDATEFSVTADESNPITSISWNFGDGNTSTLENPTHTYANTGDYTVNVSVTTATDSKTETKEITIYNVPTANSITDFEGCTENASYEYNLSSKDSEVLGTQLSTEFRVAYYPSLTDAQNGTNVLSNLYNNTLSIETIVARIQNVNNPACFSTTSFDLVTKKAPVVNIQTDWTVCDTDLDGFHTFDLSQKTTSILENNSPTTFTVSYYLNQTDLDARANAIEVNYTNIAPRQEIFWRIENSMYSTCYGEGTFFIEVISGVTANTPNNFEVCDTDNDGFFEFDLSTKELEILGTQNAASVTITFHTTLLEAEDNANALNKNTYTNTKSYNETVFVRIENAADISCYNTTSFDLVISETPIEQTVTNWQVCDDNNDGLFFFDLNIKNDQILGSQSLTNYTITYHNSLADAQSNLNSIAGSYDNTTNPQTVFYRLENNSNTQCFIVGDFDVEVYDTPIAFSAVSIAQCDTDESGRSVFNFSQKDTEILNGQDASVFQVAYFSNEADAVNNQNQLPKTAYSNTNLEEVIYARVQHINLEACFAVSQFQISILPLPEPSLDDQYVICPDSPELTIDGGNFESWSWKDENGSERSVSRNINITQLGKYSLSVTSNQSGITCEKTVDFEVVSSGAPDDFTTEILNFSDIVTIEIDAIGIGEFEYSSDGENFQNSNRLEVFPGVYTVYVRDKFLCRTLTKEVIALGFRKFFTPNGDGIHEYWNIIGVENFPNSQIHIFDRQGKLLKQITPESQGWDGTFQGTQLPSSDYWFRFINEDGTVHVGHFTLKR